MLFLFDPGWHSTIVPTEDHRGSSKHCYSIVIMLSCIKDDKKQYGKKLKMFLFFTLLGPDFDFCIQNLRADEPAGDAEHTM